MKYVFSVVILSAMAVAQSHIVAGNLNQICFADQQIGGDLGAKVNACDTSLGSGAGEIWINHFAGTSWTTAPTFSAPRRIRFIDGGSYFIALGVLVLNKQILVDCSGEISANLNFTGGSGIAVLLNYASSAGGSYFDWGYGIDNCLLIGPGGTNGTGGNAGTGIQIGDGSHATIGVWLHNVRTSGFTTGITWGNCSAWGLYASHSVFINNTQDLLHNICSGGALAENIRFDHSVFGWSGTNTMQANGVQIAGTGTVDINFDDCSFDGDQLVNSGGNVKTVNAHHENPLAAGASTVTSNYYTVNSATLVEVNPLYGQDCTSGCTLPTAFINLTGGTYEADHLIAYTAGSSAMGSVATFNAGGSANVGFRVDQTKQTGTFTNGLTAGTNTGWTQTCPDASLNCTFSLSTGSMILGATNLKLSNAPIAQGTFAGVTGTGACATGSLGAHSGGSWSGNITCGTTTGASTLTITPGQTAPNGWYCSGSDVTHTAIGTISAQSNTAVTLSFTSVSNGDIVTFSCNQF